MLQNSTGPQVQARIGEELGIAHASIVALVNDLERAGHVQRLPHPDDRRAYHVVLTPSGRIVIERAERIVDQVTAHLYGVLSSQEQDHLRRMLERIVEHLPPRMDPSIADDPAAGMQESRDEQTKEEAR